MQLSTEEEACTGTAWIDYSVQTAKQSWPGGCWIISGIWDMGCNGLVLPLLQMASIDKDWGYLQA